MRKYLKALKGFFVGNFMLVMNYILIYYVDGEEKYISEFSKLLNFKYMLGQFIFSGLAYVIIYCTIIFVVDFFNNNYKNVKIKALIKGLIFWVLIIGVSFLTAIMLDKGGALNGYIGTVFIGSSILILIFSAIIFIIYQSIQDYKINRALKEKQGK